MVCKIHLGLRPGLIRHLCDLCGASVDLTVDLNGQGPNNFPGKGQVPIGGKPKAGNVWGIFWGDDRLPKASDVGIKPS